VELRPANQGGDPVERPGPEKLGGFPGLDFAGGGGAGGRERHDRVRVDWAVGGQRLTACRDRGPLYPFSSQTRSINQSIDKS